MANTAIVIGSNWLQDLSSNNSLGVMAGLAVGKPVGVLLLCLAAVLSGMARLPEGLGWRHVFGAGLLGGIGFTMSIFIANLAFADNAQAINASKMAILAASVLSGTLGFIWFRCFGKPSNG